MLVHERTHPTSLMITGEPEELKRIEGLLELLRSKKKQEQEWIDGEVVQAEILDYLGVPLGSLMLKHCRENKGLTQQNLAGRLGTTRQYISNLETGNKNIGRKMGKKLSSFFGVAAETFLKP